MILVEDLSVGPVRDPGLLEAAARRPATTLWGRQAYPDLDLQAAALLESLVRHHALADGNKRLGWLSTVVFYGLNAVHLDAPDDDAYDLVVSIAAGDTTDVTEIAHILARWH